MNPTLTIAMPCYNTEAYLPESLDSFIGAVDDIEIVAIDDGSTDRTLTILNDYARRYPGIVRVFHQENAHWGGAINRALREARGTFLMVLDSDDYLDTEACKKLALTMRETETNRAQVDLFITNYVYNHVADHTTRRIRYRKMMPANRPFTWNDMNRPGFSEYLMLHAMAYRTSVLHQSGLVLPEGVAYMDSVYALHPLPFVRTLYYLDVDLYYYLIGREGQSIDIEVLKRNIGEQLLATRTVINDFDYTKLCLQNPQLALQVARYLSTMMTVSTVYLFKINTPESIEQVRGIWDYLKAQDPAMYRKVLHSMAGLAYRRTRGGRAGVRGTYTLVNKVFKFA